MALAWSVKNAQAGEADISAAVLIVEDERLTRDAYARALTADGHTVRIAAGAEACRAALRAQPADVIVLDLGLPDGGPDMLSLARELCSSGDYEVIVVTMRANVETRVAALDLGASDYLVKPVDVRELAARVRRLHRRTQERRGKRYQFGEWTIDCEQRTIIAADSRTAILTRGEFDLLVLLIEAQGRIVSRERLSDAVSRGQGDLRSVDALVSRVRRKLGDENQSAQLITTSPGFGYRIGVSATAL